VIGETIAPGLSGDWLNGWLAALGITVLVQGTRLSWTADGIPKARFAVHGDQSLAEAVAAAMPRAEDLAELAIADLPRNVSLQTYRGRAQQARGSHDPSLAACLTDLGRTDDGTAEHSPLDPPAPRGETLFTRLIRCRKSLPSPFDLSAGLEASLNGPGRRVPANGLGFDCRRLAAAAIDEKVTVDPIIECLTFFGLSFFPVRGTGTTARTRGWALPASRRGAFTWPVWLDPVDRWGIDAVLDRWYRDGRRAATYGVNGAYRSVPFRPQVRSDVTRAFAAQRVW
jgi:hypothetical protein